jgi:hypothetical protein
MAENPDITPGAPDATVQSMAVPTAELDNQCDEK